MSAGQPVDWEALRDSQGVTWRRWWNRVLVVGGVYLAWSSICLALHAVQDSWIPPAFVIRIVLWVLLSGGPPIILLAFGPTAWSSYLLLSVLVAFFAAGTALSWRRRITLSVWLAVATLVFWGSGWLLLIAAYT